MVNYGLRTKGEAVYAGDIALADSAIEGHP